jgi:hypothetical protein
MFSKKHEEMIELLKINSCLFNEENHQYDNSILTDNGMIKEFAVGWCYGEDLSFRPRTNEIAIMIERIDVNTDEIYRYWIHIDKYTFAELFIPDFWEEGETKCKEGKC